MNRVRADSIFHWTCGKLRAMILFIHSHSLSASVAVVFPSSTNYGANEINLGLSRLISVISRCGIDCLALMLTDKLELLTLPSLCSILSRPNAVVSSAS